MSEAANFAEHPRCPTCLHVVEPHEVLFDPSRGIVAHNGREARLSPHEFALATELFKSHPRANDKDRLFDAIYAEEIAEGDFPAPKILDVFICKLRKKLSPIGIVVTTEWGYGYGITLADPELASELIRNNVGTHSGGGYRWDPSYDEVLRQLVDRKAGLQQIARTLAMPYLAVHRAMVRLDLDYHPQSEAA